MTWSIQPSSDWASHLGQIEEAFAAGEEVTLETLAAKNLARGRFDVLKVLGDGELTVAVQVTVDKFTGSAKEKIAAAGGSATEL